MKERRPPNVAGALSSPRIPAAPTRAVGTTLTALRCGGEQCGSVTLCPRGSRCRPTTSTNTISGATIARPEGSQPTMAPTARVVLVATDDTEASAPALRFARTLAERGAAVHALHV